MDLRQLAALVAVADHGTFSAAADSLHTVQSNVSSHVANLEKELGATLFDRAAGRLTEEGLAVVGRARRVQGELSALVADVGALRSDVRGRVHLGVLGTTGRWLVPRLATRVTEAHPGITLRPKAELDGVRLLAALCFEGWACGIVPASAVPSWLEGPWRAVGVDGLPLRRIGLATRARGLPSAPAKAVARILGEAVMDGAIEEPGIHLVWR